jgi:UPF0755 protein
MINNNQGMNSHTTVRILLVLFVLVCCIVVGLGGLMVSRLSTSTVDTYGLPNAKLSNLQVWAMSIKLLQNEAVLINPVDPLGQRGNFKVDIGESVDSIAYRLEKRKIIHSAEALLDYLLYTGMDTGVQAGNYQLSPAQSTIQIAYLLQDATPEDVDFRILAGWRAEEIAGVFANSGLNITGESFIKGVYEPSIDTIQYQWIGMGSLEGFLYPGAYSIPRTATLEDILLIFLERFNTEVSQDIRTGLIEQGLDVRQAIILASIIEREAVVDEELPIIASVFLNRLALGMKLESDPTVQYALGFSEVQLDWWTNPLSLEDLEVISPYNTYAIAGLPPGPICNPDISAIEAVASPAQMPYLYFRASCDNSGKHNFAITYEEHLLNACP